MNVLVVIPARGGSKGIPRKNLRPLGKKPLIAYSIKMAVASSFKPDVYVSTDDEEIAWFALKFGAMVVERGDEYSNDQATLDSVVYHALGEISQNQSKCYDLVVTVQPTSPLLKTETLDSAIQRFVDNEDLDTLIAAKEDTGLSWGLEAERFYPMYKERVNRQYLSPTYRETGGFLISKSKVIAPNNRIGSNVDLYLVEGEEGIDIDTFEDWSLCEYFLTRKKILFVVSGYKDIGMGHVYNTLLLASDILKHQIEFLVDKKSQLAFDAIADRNFKVRIQTEEDIFEDIKKISPNVIINDRLDTSEADIKKQKSLGCTVINFEDLGDGACLADLVINAIYPERQALSNHYFGYKYFLLRDEFLFSRPAIFKQQASNCLVTFGGTDSHNYTYKVISAIYDFCEVSGIEINVVAGLGYEHYESLKDFKNIKVHKDTKHISSFMRVADIAFTSAGRTTYELASMLVPSIVLAQNARELTHLFATSENGFINLGLGIDVSRELILSQFIKLVEDSTLRQDMINAMISIDLRTGRRRVLKLIEDTLS